MRDEDVFRDKYMHIMSTDSRPKCPKCIPVFRPKKGQKRNPMGRHTAYITYIREYTPPSPPGNLSIREILVITTSTSVYPFSPQGSQCEMSTFLASVVACSLCLTRLQNSRFFFSKSVKKSVMRGVRVLRARSA